MRGGRLALACALAALAGCAGRERGTAPAASIADTLVAGLRAGLAQPVPEDQVLEWLGIWRSVDPAFTLDSLVWGPPAPIGINDARAGRPGSTRAPADPKYVASADGSLELGANFYFEFSPEHGAMWDADAAIELTDVRAESSWVFAFCGTSCRHDAAAWIGPRRFAVAGVSTNDSLPDRTLPHVILVDWDRRLQVWGTGRGLGVAGARDRYDRAVESAWSRRYARRRPV